MSETTPLPAAETMLRHQRWLRRLASSLVVDAASADDLVQQALLAALERPPRDAGRPRAWLAAVARNLARRFGASERSRLERERAAAADERLAPTDEVVARAALQHDVSSAVLGLPEPYRTTLLLRFFDDLPPRAIAQRTGVPVETVKTRLRRGLELVRERLVQRDSASSPPWAIALLGLLDESARRALAKALATGAAGGAGAGAGAGAATLGTFGVMGVLGMSMKLKIAAAALLVAGGAIAVVKLNQPAATAPMVTPALTTERGARDGAPATLDTPPPAKLEPSRSTEAAPPAAPEPAPATDATAVACTVEGVVRTAVGEPATGAVVVLEDASHGGSLATIASLLHSLDLFEETGDTPGSRQRAVADAEGIVRFEGLSAGASVNVAAVHPVEGTALASGVVVAGAAEPTRVALTLTPGVVLHGAVTDEHGDAVAGARIFVDRFARVDGGTSTSTLFSLRADADGRFRTVPLPFRGFRVGCLVSGFLQQTAPPLELPESEREHRVDFRLVRAPPLRGRLLAADGTPARVREIAVDLVVVASEHEPPDRSDFPRAIGDAGTVLRDEDRYVVTPHRAMPRFVSVWADHRMLGFAPVVDPDVGPDVVVDVTKAPSPPAKGTLIVQAVRADDGEAIAAFELEFGVDPTAATRGDDLGRSERRKTDAGRVEIAALVAGTYDVTVRADGLAPCWRSVELRPPATTAVVALESASAALHGRVEDENGRPVEGAKLFLVGSDGAPVLPAPECTATANALGEFRFESIPEGGYLVVAETEAFAPASASAVAASDGEPRAPAVVLTLKPGIEVTIDPRVPGEEVLGPFMFRFRDERGAPVLDDRRHPGSLTQRSGAGFEFRLAPGRYTVEVFSPLLAPARATFVAAPGLTVPVEMSRREE